MARDKGNAMAVFFLHNKNVFENVPAVIGHVSLRLDMVNILRLCNM